MKILSKVDAAYLAGLIDGEGSITLARYGKGRFRCPLLTIASSDRELIDWLLDVTGEGVVVTKAPRQSSHRVAYAWCVKNVRALFILKMVVGFLRIPRKHQRAQHLLRDYDRLTRRNGRYTDSERQAKERFEDQFFAL